MIVAAMFAASLAAAPLRAMRYDGITRTYRVHRPADLARTRAVPLVVMLHGGFGTSAQAEADYGWDSAADRDGFVVIYPDGVRSTWNAGGTCCGAARKEQIDDVGFLTSLVNRIAFTQNIDRSRVYFAGMSNGAMMAYRMACDSPLAIRGIASVAGAMLVPCNPSRRLSVLEIHGTADRNIPYGGGLGGGPARLTIPPAASVNERWRAIDGCSSPNVSTTGSVTTSIAPCDDDTSVSLISVAGAGHQWPGGARKNPRRARLATELGFPLDQPSQALNATDVICRFFDL